MDTLTRDELRTLMEVRDDHCVSIYMPTHRTGDIQQDPIRLKNLANQAQEKLVAAGARPAAARELLKPIYNYVDDTLFWQNRSEGLAIFVSPDRFRFGHLPYRFDETVNVGGRFVIKPLLPVLSGNNCFYLLAMSQNTVKLLRCTEYGADEIDLTGLTTLSRADATRFEEHERSYQQSAGTAGQGAIKFQQYNAADQLKNEILRYFQQVDRGLHEILKDEKAPLVFAGVDYLFPIYQQANTYPNLLPQIIEGNPQGLNTDRLRELGWKTVQPFFQKTQDAALAKYDEIAGKGYSSSNIMDVVPAAYYGRVDTLFIALGPQIWGKLNTDNSSVTIHENPEPDDLDLLDLAAAYTLSQKGTVFTLPSDRVFDHSPVAAMLRY
jgi:hypothetical protein